MSERPTPSQTIGPFFAIMFPLGSNELVPRDSAGALCLEGQVFDGAGQSVPDALIEAWQANRHGKYHHPADEQELPLEPGFTGYGRCATDAAGTFRFWTVKPGRVPAATGEARQAPHITLTIFARGLLKHLVTRVYFADESTANAADPLLSSIDDPAIRATMIAEMPSPNIAHFDVHLQGENETAFLAV